LPESTHWSQAEAATVLYTPSSLGERDQRSVWLGDKCQAGLASIDVAAVVYTSRKAYLSPRLRVN